VTSLPCDDRAGSLSSALASFSRYCVARLDERTHRPLRARELRDLFLVRLGGHGLIPRK